MDVLERSRTSSVTRSRVSSRALDDAATGTLFGLAYYRCLVDERVRRGHVQRAVVVLAKAPYFNLFMPLLRATMDEINGGRAADEALHALYTGLQGNLGKNMTMSLFDRTFQLNVPLLDVDECGGVSLTDLVRTFRENVMYMWYALLLGQRILFVGQPASLVCNAVLATPLLVAPLAGFMDRMHPYVSLYDCDVLNAPTYVAGTTNLMFEGKTQLFDVLGSPSSGTCLHQGGVKLSGADRQLVRGVLSGIEEKRGEQWVRHQFRNHCVRFLESVQADTMRAHHRRWLGNFRSDPVFVRHMFAAFQRAKSDETDEGIQPLLDVIADPDGQLSKSKAFYRLEGKLNDLAHVDDFCAADAIPLVMPFLNDDSATVRKYAVGCLAKVAISVRGQIDIVSQDALRKVVAMLDDSMPNVAAAAAVCLLNVARLRIGVWALVELGVHAKLVHFVVSDACDNLNLKRTAASILLHFYRADDAELAPLDVEPFYRQLGSADREYVMTIVALLDLNGVPAPHVGVSPAVTAALVRLRAEDWETRAHVVSELVSDLVADRALVFDVLEAGGLEAVFEYKKLRSAEHKFSRLAFTLLTMLTMTREGSRRAVDAGLVEDAIKGLGATNPLYLFAVARFLEVMAQSPAASAHMVKLNAATDLAKFVVRHAGHAQLCIVTLPALGALKHLFLTQPDSADALAGAVAPLSKFRAAASSAGDMANLDAQDEDAADKVNADDMTEVEVDRAVESIMSRRSKRLAAADVDATARPRHRKSSMAPLVIKGLDADVGAQLSLVFDRADRPASESQRARAAAQRRNAQTARTRPRYVHAASSDAAPGSAAGSPAARLADAPNDGDATASPTSEKKSLFQKLRGFGKKKKTKQSAETPPLFTYTAERRVAASTGLVDTIEADLAAAPSDGAEPQPFFTVAEGGNLVGGQPFGGAVWVPKPPSVRRK